MYYYLPMARTDPQLNLRLPADLKDMLEGAATKNNRTLTAETVDRLITSFEAGSSPASLRFLMTRMEMRAAEAELDAIQARMLISELMLSLRHAVLLFTQEQIEGDAALNEILLGWNTLVAEAFEAVEESSTGPQQLAEEGIRKIKELQEATKRANRTLGEIRGERSDIPADRSDADNSTDAIAQQKNLSWLELKQGIGTIDS